MLIEGYNENNENDFVKVEETELNVHFIMGTKLSSANLATNKRNDG